MTKNAAIIASTASVIKTRRVSLIVLETSGDPPAVKAAVRTAKKHMTTRLPVTKQESVFSDVKSLSKDHPVQSDAQKLVLEENVTQNPVYVCKAARWDIMELFVTSNVALNVWTPTASTTTERVKKVAFLVSTGRFV